MKISKNARFPLGPKLGQIVELKPRQRDMEWAYGSSWITGCWKAFFTPQKNSLDKPGKCVFGSRTTWGSMFTKVILLSMVEACWWFWKKRLYTTVTKWSTWRRVGIKKFTKEKMWQKSIIIKEIFFPNWSENFLFSKSFEFRVIFKMC